MNRTIRLLGSLAVGIVALVAVGVGVTALLDPYVWPSAMLGIPAGVVAGVSAVVLLYAGLTVRDERERTGSLSPRTRTLALASVGGVAGLAGAVAVSAVALVGLGMGLASAMLFVGVPAALVLAAAGALAGVMYGRRRGPTPAVAA